MSLYDGGNLTETRIAVLRFNFSNFEGLFSLFSSPPEDRLAEMADWQVTFVGSVDLGNLKLDESARTAVDLSGVWSALLLAHVWVLRAYAQM